MTRRLSKEERALWERVNRDTQVLTPAAPPPAETPPLDAPPSPPARAPRAVPPRPVTAAPTPAPFTAPAPPPPTPIDDHRPGRVPGVDRRTAERLRRGKMLIEARLDLHGHTLAGGQRAVTAFVAQSFAAGRRCVLIITGKGNRQADGRRAPGVLKAALPGWLGEPPCADKVLTFSAAQPADGGGGAYYLLLRRRRAPDASRP